MRAKRARRAETQLDRIILHEDVGVAASARTDELGAREPGRRCRLGAAQAFPKRVRERLGGGRLLDLRRRRTRPREPVLAAVAAPRAEGESATRSIDGIEEERGRTLCQHVVAVERLDEVAAHGGEAGIHGRMTAPRSAAR